MLSENGTRETERETDREVETERKRDRGRERERETGRERRDSESVEGGTVTVESDCPDREKDSC